ncbi:MAG: anthranilate/aminodeoxychorismate synthase component II [Deltaproteobacteria bacterium CG2_30_63_29]|nr:MAG: anthranilate/aminodeoxychorismate synthase component II [Deltaproteobacteria bacterium CG2_30_63_29]PJB47498.1 MAG: anthranilate/aminodeoxychorismate synthase component II [Deltaproteobacteria bacterium CG_4_9_14_3_um_filter_63_12]
MTTSSARVLIIDNYDSFVGNLYQYVGQLGAKPLLHRNDALSLSAARALNPTHLLISPGPKGPRDAGCSKDFIAAFAGQIPILGVCLGHQAIAEQFGAQIVPAKRLVHGKTSWIHHDTRGLFRNSPNPFRATRYHSLAVERSTLPDTLVITAWTDDGEIMGLRHRDCERAPIEGVQFHPESILSQEGLTIVARFLELGCNAAHAVAQPLEPR